MKSITLTNLIGIGLLFCAACASKPCREPKAPEQPVGQTAMVGLVPGTKFPEPDATAPKKASERVKVAKANGSRQCEGGAISAEVMEKELTGITVFSRALQSDGLMRPQVCGAGTGAHNVYEIDVKDLPKAQSLGFRLWKK